VDSKGRVTIPLYFREIVGIRPESLVSLEIDETSGSIIIKPSSQEEEFLVDYNLTLDTPKSIEKAIKFIIDSGGEIRFLECLPREKDKTRCSVTLSLIDMKAAHTLRDRLLSGGIKVEEMKSHKRRLSL
jgi:bifunctional DNA-binding transcriptional regulator/antitoxin component of YhaV-PrlF toxin-antitoxin module